MLGLTRQFFYLLSPFWHLILNISLSFHLFTLLHLFNTIYYFVFRISLHLSLYVYFYGRGHVGVDHFILSNSQYLLQIMGSTLFNYIYICHSFLFFVFPAFWLLLLLFLQPLHFVTWSVFHTRLCFIFFVYIAFVWMFCPVLFCTLRTPDRILVCITHLTYTIFNLSFSISASVAGVVLYWFLSSFSFMNRNLVCVSFLLQFRSIFLQVSLKIVFHLGCCYSVVSRSIVSSISSVGVFSWLL